MNTSLYLFPIPVLQTPPAEDQILEALGQIEFLGEALGKGRYRTGSGFFQHISFAGCSPQLQLDAPEDGSWEFCHLQIHGDQQPPPLRIAPLRGRPRCAHCRASIPDWKSLLTGWQGDSSQDWHCEQCGHHSRVAELDWRGYGVGARCSVEIHQVYPGEAMPGDGLLRVLAESTGRTWQHAWAASQYG